MAKQMMDIGLVAVMSGDVQIGEDLEVQNGDFTVAESTLMHQRQLIMSGKGEFKENPTVGVGGFNYIDDEGFNNLLSEISDQFLRDGMDVKTVALGADGIIKTGAAYK